VCTIHNCKLFLCLAAETNANIEFADLIWKWSVFAIFFYEFGNEFDLDNISSFTFPKFIISSELNGMDVASLSFLRDCWNWLKHNKGINANKNYFKLLLE
jgi:hypothetical protein